MTEAPAGTIRERVFALFLDQPECGERVPMALYWNRAAVADWLQDPESQIRPSIWWDERDAWRWFQHPTGSGPYPYLFHLVGFPVFLDEWQTETIRVRYADGTLAPLK